MYPTTFGTFADPNTIVGHFHLREGDVVADFGAGSGHYMKPLADAVGKEGRVYLCEIQKNLVDALTVKAHEARLTTVYPVWCDFETPGGTKFKDGQLDAVLLSNALFQIVDKEIALQECARSIRSGGKLFVIDWTDSFGGLGPTPQHVVTEDRARTLLLNAGFSIDHTFPAGDHHYGLACRKK